MSQNLAFAEGTVDDCNVVGRFLNLLRRLPLQRTTSAERASSRRIVRARGERQAIAGLHPNLIQRRAAP